MLFDKYFFQNFILYGTFISYGKCFSNFYIYIFIFKKNPTKPTHHRKLSAFLDFQNT